MPGCSTRKPATVVTPSIGTRQTGIASWYGSPYHGRATASGEIYDMERDTAAHRRFAFGTWVRVNNLDNGRHTEVRINDRGPFKRGRIIDLSRAAARRVDMLGPGTARVRLTVIAAPRMSSSSSPPLRWGVQVASFRDAARANALAARLNGEGRRARVEENAGWTRVVISGADESESEAQILLNQVRPAFASAVKFSTAYPQP